MRKISIPLIMFSLILTGCGKNTTITEEHTHSFSSEWSFNDEYHWHQAICEHNELKENEGMHDFDAEHTCKVCGYEQTMPQVTIILTASKYKMQTGEESQLNVKFEPNDILKNGFEFVFVDGEELVSIDGNILHSNMEGTVILKAVSKDDDRIESNTISILIEDPKYEDYAKKSNFLVRAGTPACEDTNDGLKISVKTTDKFEIKVGNQYQSLQDGYYLQFKYKSNITKYDIGGSNYSGGRETIVNIDTSISTLNYSVTELDDGWFYIQTPLNNVRNTYMNKDELAIRFYNFNIDGQLILKDFNISPYKEVSLKPVFKYEFTGDEKDLASFGEGKITFVDANGFKIGNKYEIYWGNSNGKLNGYLPLVSKEITSPEKSIVKNVDENVYIPDLATHLVVYKTNNGTFSYDAPYETLELSQNKVSKDQLQHKFASVSDVHSNYPQGYKYWINALNEFERQNVEYVIVSGDIGENEADFLNYKTATEASSFNGLIFASIGNHEQNNDGRSQFFKYAMYDGKTKTWVSIDKAPDYFKNNYNGALNVQVFYNDYENNNNTYYYYALIDNNLFFFMDQMLGDRPNTNLQDNFSRTQLDVLETTLFKYSSYNLFIIEHAPITQFKVGDNVNPVYGTCLSLNKSYENNNRFADILKEYKESFMISGHTHIAYEDSVCYSDKVYDENGNITDLPIAHLIHNSSTAQPRVLENGTLVYSSDYSSGSQAYICNQYESRVAFEAHILKDRTPNQTSYNESSFKNDINVNNSYVCSLEHFEHEEPYIKKNYAIAENAFTKQGNNDFVDTSLGLRVNTTISSQFEIRTGLQNYPLKHDYYVELFISSSDITSFTLGGSNYNENNQKEIRIDLVNGGDGYKLGVVDDNITWVAIPLSSIQINDMANNKFALNFSSFDKNGEIVIKEISFSSFKDRTIRGQYFEQGKDTAFYYKEDNYRYIEFDYRIISGTQFRICFLDKSWAKFYGYFSFVSSGEEFDYAGVETTKLANDYVHVVIDLSLVDYTNNVHNRSNAPSTTTIAYMRGDLIQANGYLDKLNVHN